MSLQLTSPAFQLDGRIPIDYTCNGRNVSPPLSIAGVPEDAGSLVLIMDDPDAAKEPAGSGKTFNHWVLYNIDPVDQEIEENTLPASARAGNNSRGGTGYIAPCPPTFPHAYYFRLFAVDSKLQLPDGSSKQDILKVIKGHIIEETELVAYYEQPASK